MKIIKKNKIKYNSLEEFYTKFCDDDLTKLILNSYRIRNTKNNYLIISTFKNYIYIKKLINNLNKKIYINNIAFQYSILQYLDKDTIENLNILLDDELVKDIFNFYNSDKFNNYILKEKEKYNEYLNIIKLNWFNNLKIGDFCDVIDEKNRWYESCVIDKDNEGRLKIHYLFWNKSYDKWICKEDIDKISKAGSKIWLPIPNRKLRIGDRVDAKDYDIKGKKQIWNVAVVKDIKKNKALVHYSNYDYIYDRWVDITYDIFPYGHKSQLKKKKHIQDYKKIENKYYSLLRI